ncbi:MAG: NAD-dependent epimerase/dehydratase family protein [Candidatus Latescibacterota bacterium]|nr:NAD-dependent epimerase/dehydratase family protein [Candidatus Latescibacterota bacterium]
MKSIVITGSTGLVGADTARLFGSRGFKVLGIDNDMRRRFFGDEASTIWQRKVLEEALPDYRHFDFDIRDQEAVGAFFEANGREIVAIVHAAAQPSHDWAARDPIMDFSVNANGTLTLLESVRRHCPAAAFLFMSTNKVYGDAPNRLPLVELDTRWEIESGTEFAGGIDESMSIDQSTHSLFGVSKAAGDLLVQEYGRYFGLQTGVFRGGCLTGGGHSGTEMHGFLSYLMRCCVDGRPYTIYGYQGKQVRDNLHASDLAEMFWHFVQQPRVGAVYNVGGSRHVDCSMLEAIALCEAASGKNLNYSYDDQNREGDHIWYVSNIGRFRADFPDWEFAYDSTRIIEELHASWWERLDARK